MNTNPISREKLLKLIESERIVVEEPYPMTTCGKCIVVIIESGRLDDNS